MNDQQSQKENDSPGNLARSWLRAWDTGDLSLLRIAPDFVHTSPMGRIEGAEKYLSIVEPLSIKQVRGITVRDVLESEGRAAITYEVETQEGSFEACDWVFVENGLIREVNSYYDSASNSGTA